MTLSLHRANESELQRLYAHYELPPKAPFFIDVSGPPPLMRWEDFAEYCTGNESWMMRCQSGDELLGCAHFRDKQLGLELANFDTVFFNGYPKPGSNEAREFGDAFRAVCAEQKLSRVQLLALKDEHDKIAFLESVGFKHEGVLREHFFFSNLVHDLVMLGWTSDDRSARMAAIAEKEDEAYEMPVKKRRTIPPPASAKAVSNPAEKKSGILSRRVGPQDKDTLIRWYGHPLIQETIEDEELSPAGLRAKAKKLASLDEFRDGECAFIIEFDGEQVALAHIMWIDWVSRTGEIDYFLDPELRPGPFLARMILIEIGRLAFEGFGLRKLYGFTYGSNDISVRLNAQFLEDEALLKDYLPRAGGGADVRVQGLPASEFARKYAKRIKRS